MRLSIPSDQFNNPKPPRLFLCTTGKKKMGELKAYDIAVDGKWNSYGTLSFGLDRKYVDIITGNTVIDPLFDKAEGLRKVYAENIGYFVIQDPDSIYSDRESKTLSCFSSEYETANKYLENFRVNTGEIDSVEVMYNETVHGYDYAIDSSKFYKPASGGYDSYESYYIKQETDADSYVWQQIQITDEDDYNSHFDDGANNGIELYIKNYPNVQFYDKTNPELSLLHIIFKQIPDWTIKNVDASLWRKERTFSEDRISVYDFLTKNVTDTFKCVIEWDTISNEVSFYEEAEDGITTDNTVQTRFDTDVYISRENLASEINIKYSTDNIKTKLRVSGSDGLDVREVNLGKNYIMNLGFYHTIDWMEPDLYLAYDKYLKSVNEYSPLYTAAMQKWVASNNKWNDLMNAVPTTNDVARIGDEFKKLYCIYAPVYEEGASSDDIQAATDAAEAALIKKLNLYHVDEDINANKTDNILLRLKNSNDDVATIRIYDAKMPVGSGASYDDNASYYTQKVSESGVITYDKVNISSFTDFAKYDKDNLYTNNYTIQSVVVRAKSGLSDAPSYWSMSSDNLPADAMAQPFVRWLENNLTAEAMGLQGFSISYIGTMGAYFVLAKDEKQKENIEDYGVNLLKEKHKTYTTIFQTQTEAMFSQEKYQCTVSDEPPSGVIANGTRWLDTDASPAVLKQYDSTKQDWVTIPAEISISEQDNYENYQRYIDNYEKLQTVQDVLVEKERIAQYYLNGYSVNQTIPLDDDLEKNMGYAAQNHFKGYTVRKRTFEAVAPLSEHLPVAGEFPNEYLYTFTTSFDKYTNVYAVYLNGKTPYVAYLDSQGVHQLKINRISNATEFSKFFNEDQWARLSPFIREDEFSDDNFLLTGYESEEERLDICKELMESANKKLNTLCQPSLEFSMTMANIFALPEFKPLIDKDQFKLGNFVRIYIRDGYVKRARLLEIHINYSDLSDFSATFGNLVTTKSEIDKHAELLSQAVTAGKQVAASAGSWQKAVDKSNKLDQDIAQGLQDAALEVGKSDGQSITWDSSGIWGRKLVDGTTDQYEPEQFRMINNKLVFSNDGFKTSKSVFGKYTVNGEERWGTLAEYVTADTIEGKFIKGGKIEIGEGDTKFIVDTDGSVKILTQGENTYALAKTVNAISASRQYRTELTYDGPTVFSDKDQKCEITCNIYNWDTPITETVIYHKDKLGNDKYGKFSWIRNSNLPNEDDVWNKKYINRTGANANRITITHEDVVQNAQFICKIEFDDEILKEGE